MDLAAGARLTLEEFMAMDETEPASEYACGEVLKKPMPTRAHAAIQFFLATVLGQLLARTNLGAGFTELRCIFGPPDRQRIYVPDLAIVAHERVTNDRFLRTAPDVIVEILSPDQDMARFVDKIQFYLLHGVRLVWVVDPIQRTVAVLTPGRDAQVLTTADTLDGGDVLPGLALQVAELFAGPRSEAGQSV